MVKNTTSDNFSSCFLQAVGLLLLTRHLPADCLTLHVALPLQSRCPNDGSFIGAGAHFSKKEISHN
jgi:hypothetical protein